MIKMLFSTWIFQRYVTLLSLKEKKIFISLENVGKSTALIQIYKYEKCDILGEFPGV